MNRVATAVFIAGVGLHCSAAAEPEPSAREELASNTDSGRGPAAPVATDAPAAEVPAADAPRALAIFSERQGSLVTSRAMGDDGASYVAGVFSGALHAGDALLHSRGGDDVFLARLARDGSVAWARSIGSLRAEVGPHVTFRDGQVKLLAVTHGEVDCGQGPLATWSSDMFFLCVFGPDGKPISGGAFPTGNP